MISFPFGEWIPLFLGTNTIPFLVGETWIRINRFGLNHIALVQCAVEDVDFKFDGVVWRKRILHGELVFYRAADGFGVVVVAQAMETSVESHRIVKDKRIGWAGGHMRAQQWRLHEHTVFRLQVVDHHILIMWVVEAKGISRVGIVEAKVTVAIGIREGDDTLAAESAVSIEQIGKTLVFNRRLNGVFHWLLT